MFQNNLMMAAGSLGGNVVTFELTATPDAQGSATTHTYSSVSLGTAKTGRQIVVCVSNGGLTELTSVTVGGASCTRVVQGTYTKGSIWIIELAAGTSADIVTTGTAQFGGIVVYAIYGAKTTRHDTFATGNESPVSDDITIPANGLAIGLNNSATDNAGWETTWTGLTKQSDLEVSTNVALSTATLTPKTVQTDLGVTATIDGPTINWQDGCCASWGPSTGFMEATGGTETTDGDYKVHSFTASGTFTVTKLGDLATVQYLVIAGGGSGGFSNGGGGGAGGFRIDTEHTVTAQAYTITVGAGGAAATSLNTYGSNGATSTFDTIDASGGGTGGSGSAGSSANGKTGGSGGGGRAANSGGSGGAGNSGSYSPVEGYDGGSGTFTAPNYGAGAGGGSGGVGANGSGSAGGNGGIGSANSITGSSVTYASGGGGSAYNGGTVGTASAGGGTDGKSSSSAAADDATANTGGGGGGGGKDVSGSAAGGAGGSGIVIIRYKFQ